MHRAMHETVREVGRAVESDGIDAHYHLGGRVTLARSRVQLDRIRGEVATAHERGFTEEDERLIDADEASGILDATSVLGGSFTPHCAVVHPSRLVRGLARVVEASGVTIHEQTRVRSVAQGRVETDAGTVRAEVVVRATEGYTPGLAGQRRAVVPVYSLVLATEPLPRATWDEIGLSRRETFSDHRHLIIYGQRTDDDRLVFGGRGAPYHLGSRIRPEFDRDPRVFAKLRETLVDLFPAVGPARIDHAWGGALGIPRDWCASVGLDRGTGLAWAGGYVGDGVATTNLAGRTQRDHVLGHDTALVRHPWVGHRSKRWEPEPLRWLGINAGLRAMTVADTEERVTRRPSLVARAMAPFVGG
jgi:glycine/D-amino acid oxidase-like deaminating enzyme